MKYPRIVERRNIRVSPWLVLVEKEVQLAQDAGVDVYHCVTQNAYVGILAQMENGLIPLVGQYRPAVEEFTWELPAGTVEPGETALQAARRELLEETGLDTEEMIPLGQYHPDTGRLMIDSYLFYARCKPADERSNSREDGLQIRYVSPGELKQMIISGEFRHQLHLAALGAAWAHGVKWDRM